MPRYAPIRVNDRIVSAFAREQVQAEAQEKIFAVPREDPVQADGQGQFLFTADVGPAGRKKRSPLRGEFHPQPFDFGGDHRHMRGHEGINDRVVAAEIPKFLAPAPSQIRMSKQRSMPFCSQTFSSKGKVSRLKGKTRKTTLIFLLKRTDLRGAWSVAATASRLLRRLRFADDIQFQAQDTLPVKL